MPKRRSLVGTAREAIGALPAKPPETATAPAETPGKRARKPAQKAKRAPAPPVSPPPPELAEPAAEAIAAAPEPADALRPPSPYEAIAQFATAALRQNLETSARLARCKSPMDVFATQAAHATALAQSFFSASLKLMQLGLSGASWTSIRRTGPYPR
jgi:hypothetical protein